jgi:hypothetical protein
VHIPTGKWYIGSRTAKGCHKNDGYICSSKIVKPLILKNPKEWRREILGIGTADYIRKLENKILKKLDARNDPESYNLHNGDGKFSYNLGSPGRWQSKETKEKIRNSLLNKKHTPERRKNISIAITKLHKKRREMKNASST